MVGGTFIFNSITEKSLGVEERENAMGADMGSAESVEDMCARLRAKYTTRAGGAPDGGCPAAMEVGTAHSEQSTADTFRRATREREVRCCPKCQGSRELREDYNFRVIYRECDECVLSLMYGIVIHSYDDNVAEASEATTPAAPHRRLEGINCKLRQRTQGTYITAGAW